MALQMMPPEGQPEAAGRLRIGIALDSYNVSAWIGRVLDDLLAADFLEIVTVVLIQAPVQQEDGHRSWLFRKYQAWDDRRGAGENDPLAPVDVADRLRGVAALTIELTWTGPEAAAEVRARDLDVLLWLAPRTPEEGLRDAARFGTWLYAGQQLPYFREVYERAPVTRSALEVLPASGGQTATLYEAFSATEQGWSWRRNRQIPYWRGSTFALRVLRRLYRQRSAGIAAMDASTVREATAGRMGELTSAQTAGFLLRNAARTVSRRLRYVNKESSWFVAYRTERRKFVAESETLDLTGFTPIEAPNGHFYADPFVVRWADRNYLFVEDYLFAERRGCISVMEMGAGGVTSEAERVLDLPYHLSYPFVFAHQGDLYMIPETLGAGRIELYRAVDVPLRWEFVKALREDVQAVDTTLWVEAGLFYFFTNIAERGATVNDELSLFCAEDLMGEWKPHPANPLVTDVRRSRGAGRLFRRHGKLMRPAQDCSVRYGYACQLNDIEILTPEEYRERPRERIEPNWAPGLIGTHTINSNDEFEVIDGQYYVGRYRAKG